MPYSSNINLVSYLDLDGRAGFKMAMQEVDGNFFLYVGSLWTPGWAIIDVTNPEAPSLLRWLDGPANTTTAQVQVADGIMIGNMQFKNPEWVAKTPSGPGSEGILIFDVSQPDDPKEIGRWSPGGIGTHRNFYNGGRHVHVTATLPGFDGHIYGALDIADPANPQLISKWWWPGQNTAAGETYTDTDRAAIYSGLPHFPHKPLHALSLHGGAYIHNDRAYCPWMRAGLVILDVSDVAQPALISRLSFYPPLGSSIALHSAVPLPGRDLVIVNSEALNESCEEPVAFAGLVDVRNEKDPILISLFPQPRVPPGYPHKSFCAKGGRFGPHNQHQPQGMPALLPAGDLVYMTYFNAGLQVFDISEPRDPFVAAYYIPDDPPQRYGPMPRQFAVQAEDVIVDRRGFIYMTEKNSGIYVMQVDGL
jgi:hypothetical protein